jgi:hypothetical protein
MQTASSDIDANRVGVVAGIAVLWIPIPGRQSQRDLVVDRSACLHEDTLGGRNNWVTTS